MSEAYNELNKIIKRIRNAEYTEADREKYGVTEKFARGYNFGCEYAIRLLEELKEEGEE